MTKKGVSSIFSFWTRKNMLKREKRTIMREKSIKQRRKKRRKEKK